jgi:hypothetical protein
MGIQSCKQKDSFNWFFNKMLSCLPEGIQKLRIIMKKAVEVVEVLEKGAEESYVSPFDLP